MTPIQLKELGQLGWIIGPDETEEGFIKRIEIQKSFSKKNLESIAQNSAVMDVIEKEFHVKPSWIQVRYSNRGLTLWQGAASWITEYGNWIQLRKPFKKGHFLGYERDDVILHEAVHSLRFTFEEPRFEEILAHAFTKKRWRRYFGPLFATTKQASIFFITLLLTPFAPIIPFAYFLYRVGCLVNNQRTFKKALGKISILFPGLSPYTVALRLTDQEVELFAKEKETVIRDYIYEKKQNLRWQQLIANLLN